MYTFELGDAGARTPVAARFSHMWKDFDGAWKVKHHHSSVVPGDAKPKVCICACACACASLWNEPVESALQDMHEHKAITHMHEAITFAHVL